MRRLKFYFILLFILFLVSVATLAWLLNAKSPDNLQDLIWFYALIASATFSLLTLFGFGLRRLFGQREFFGAYAVTASRQAFWLAAILVISLVMLHANLFTWLNASFLILAFIFFEFFLLSRNSNTNEREPQNFT